MSGPLPKLWAKSAFLALALLALGGGERPAS